MHHSRLRNCTSLCLDEGVLEFEEMLECGLCEGNSFLMGLLSPLPFSRGEEVPLVAELEPFPLPSSLATSTTSSWSLFSPSLSCNSGMVSPWLCRAVAGIHGGRHTFSSLAFRFFKSCSCEGEGGLRGRNFSRSFGEMEFRCEGRGRRKSCHLKVIPRQPGRWAALLSRQTCNATVQSRQS